MRRERVPPSPCPGCGTMLDGRTFTGIELAKGCPVADDVTICIECGIPAAFTSDLRLRACTVKELLALSLDTDFMRAKGIVDRMVAIEKRRR